jgi:hypothetical protein
MRSLIEYAVGLLVFLIGALLEAAHYVELIDRLIPNWLAPKINERVNFVLMAAGLLMILLAFFERRQGHSDDPNWNAHRPLPGPPTPPTIARVSTENTGNITSTGGSSTASVGDIHIHHHAPAPPIPSPSALPPRPVDPTPRHNVKFIGIKNNPLMVVGEFRNLLIPNRPVASFRYAIPSVTLRDQSGLEVHYVSPAAWLDRDTERMDIEPGGDAALVVVAAYSGTQKRWVAPRFRLVRDYTLDVFGEERVDLEEWPLKTEVLHAEIVLVGEDGISLPPEKISFELQANGQYKILPQPPHQGSL